MCVPVFYRPVAQLAEQRSPKPQVVGSSPSWPGIRMTNSPKLTKDYLVWSFIFILWGLGIYGLSSISTSYKIVPIAITIVLVATSIIVLRKTEFAKQKFEAFSKIKIEFSKVSWASLEATRKTALMVGFLIFLFALIMWAVDSFFTYIVKILL